MSVRYRQAVAASAKRQEHAQRLSSQIYHAQRDYNLGRAMSFQVQRGALRIVDPHTGKVLDAAKLRLVEAFENKTSLKKLEKLLNTRRVPSVPYAGSAAAVPEGVEMQILRSNKYKGRGN